MTRMKILLVLAGIAWPAAQSAPAIAQDNGPIALTGRVDTAFDKVSLEGIEVRVNGQPTTLAPDGSFAAQLPVAPYYEVTIAGGSIFTLNQTFGIAEIYAPQCDCLTLPPLGVVARKPGRIELFLAGDTMSGRRYIKPVWGERQLVDPADPLPGISRLLEPMRPYIESADLASVNLETVLAREIPGDSPPKSITFFSPPELAEALARAGIDHVTLGNNHTYDFLEPGLDTTIAAVEAAGLAWSGAGYDERQALQPSRLKVGGQELSLLGYVGFPGRVQPNQVAETGKGGAAFGTFPNVRMTVERERRKRRVVIAQYHGSSEYADYPSETSERRMRGAIDSGASLVASHHPHVAQGVELYNGALIAYSSGNFLFDQYFPETHGSIALKVWLDKGRFVRAEIVPLRMLEYRPVPAVGSMREEVLGRVTRLSRSHATHVSRNGGHGLVLPANKLKAAAARCPVSIDLLRSGDFENALFGDAIDRSFKLEGGQMEFAFMGRQGHVLRLEPKRGARSLSLAPATFFRKFPGRNITVSARFRSDQPFAVQLGVQEQPEGVNMFSALRGEPIQPVAAAEHPAGADWIEYSASFTLAGDAAEPLPFRPFLTFTGAGGQDAVPAAILIDDLKVVSSPDEGPRDDSAC